METAQVNPTELHERFVKALADLDAAIEERNARLSDATVAMVVASLPVTVRRP